MEHEVNTIIVSDELRMLRVARLDLRDDKP